MELAKFEYKGFEIGRDETTGLVCLTDMWKATGSHPNKRPIDWLKQESTLELLAAMASQHPSGLKPLRSKPGHGRNDKRAYERWGKEVLEAVKVAGRPDSLACSTTTLCQRSRNAPPGCWEQSRALSRNS